MRIASAPFVMAVPAALPTIAQAIAPGDSRPRPVVLENREFRLILHIGSELRCRVEHVASKAIVANEAYFYSFGTPLFDSVEKHDNRVILIGKTNTGIGVAHRFMADAQSKWIEEDIIITNSGSTPLDLRHVRCGFTLGIPFHRGKPEAGLDQHLFSAIPFLREPSAESNTQYAEYSLSEILYDECRSGLYSSPSWNFGAEGWDWRYGEHRFLITKYSQDGMEWSLIDAGRLPGDRVALRWGGFGVHDGHPDHGIRLMPGQTHRFGLTRLTAIKGDSNQAFYAFRTEMADRGHGCPVSYDPPVHWNELWDNKLVSLGGSRWVDDPEMKARYFTLADMKEAAAKASSYHCDALYLDPGWDTSFTSRIWDESRLGSFKTFVAMLAKDYGLRCSLHTSLSGWCNPSTYAEECYLLDRFGKRSEWDAKADVGGQVFNYSPICGASQQYIDATLKRLGTLATEGVAFFMFDGTSYHGECWDKNHEHPVPARVEEHVAATARMVREMHRQFPELLIELHDPVAAGGFYTPVYYGHGRCSDSDSASLAPGFDSRWAFELMWKPMQDLLSGRSIALYYYNLAYSLPLYIHVDLRTDNHNALVFWWNASTCRHLGIGGTHQDPRVVAAHKQAVLTYRRLKHHFTNGVFYGIDEQTHVHCSADGNSVVVNCFNLSSESVVREVSLEPPQFGLKVKNDYRISGASAHKRGDRYIATVKVPPQGHALIEVGS